MVTQVNLKKIYEEDYYLWLEITAQQLAKREITYLDWDNLQEEIEALGREQKNKVESYFIQLLKHLLLYQYWKSEKQYCGKGWEDKIDNFRTELEILLTAKTLYNYFVSIQETTYQKAKRSAIKKTGLSPDIFPSKCSYSIEQILDFDFLPN